jgi:biopolymer transport protein ExbD
MSWKIRHQGSPKAVENLTLQQIVEGLQDGLWEPTDEVMGPGEAQWVAIESHPKLEEIAAEIEPPPPRSESDETRLDMTPLIDVCLVLLIVMILTISYTAVQKQLEAAQVPREDQKKRQIRKVNIDEAKKAMIIVRVSMENDKPMIRVEDQVVPEDTSWSCSSNGAPASAARRSSASRMPPLPWASPRCWSPHPRSPPRPVPDPFASFSETAVFSSSLSVRLPAPLQRSISLCTKTFQPVDSPCDRGRFSIQYCR